MYKVILAGGMASGKSTVSKMFEAAGGLRFDLDEVSRRLLRPGCECTYRVAEAFGNDLLDPVTHEINRRELGRRAFATRESAELLEELEMPFYQGIYASIPYKRGSCCRCSVLLCRGSAA